MILIIARKYKWVDLHVTEHTAQLKVYKLVGFVYVDCYSGCYIQEGSALAAEGRVSSNWRTGEKVDCGARIIGVSWNDERRGMSQYRHKVKVWV